MTGPPTASKARAREASIPTTFSISSGIIRGAERVAIYGPGGAGKSNLVANMKGAGMSPLVLDLDDGSRQLDVARIGRDQLMTWDALMAAVSAPIYEKHDTIVIDSLTAAEDLAIAHVLATIPIPARDGGGSSDSIEGYGWGKGYTFVYETFLCLMMALETYHTAHGRNVVLVLHDVTAPVPNPKGEDWSRYEPRLQNSAKANSRLRVKEWVDHLFRIDFDVAVTKGKGTGVGSRSIYTTELPHAWAKTRNKALGKAGRISYPDGSHDLWGRLFSKESE